MFEYGVWCEISGGVTGYRCSWLKRNGEIQRFHTREEARVVADNLMRQTMDNPHRTANFDYSVRRFGEEE